MINVIADRYAQALFEVGEETQTTSELYQELSELVDILNENKDLYAQNDRYIMRITGDNDIGKAQLENFIDEESTYPVIAITSKLMTTGVDAKMCKLIVLENNINSMTEFKQIIGRGTRLLEDYGKTYFSIMDFRNASRLFADPGFDGEPEVVIDLGSDDPVDDPGTEDETE